MRCENKILCERQSNSETTITKATKILDPSSKTYFNFVIVTSLTSELSKAIALTSELWE